MKMLKNYTNGLKEDIDDSTRLTLGISTLGPLRDEELKRQITLFKQI